MRRNWLGIIQCVLLAAILMALMAGPVAYAVHALFGQPPAVAQYVLDREACEDAKKLLASYRTRTHHDWGDMLDPFDEAFRYEATLACSKVPGEPQYIFLSLR